MTISCSNCQKCYIGESGREAKIRLKEHQRSVNRNDRLSLVAQHTANTNHVFDWAGCEILDRHKNIKSRKILEAFHTATTLNSFNRAIDLPNCYLNVWNNIYN